MQHKTKGKKINKILISIFDGLYHICHSKNEKPKSFIRTKKKKTTKIRKRKRANNNYYINDASNYMKASMD